MARPINIGGQSGYTTHAAITLGTTTFTGDGKGGICDAFLCGAGGNLTALDMNGTSVVYNGLQAGVIYPIRLSQFTSGSVTGVVALYY